MSWFPSWSSILGAAVVIAAVQYWRIHRKYTNHRFKRFIGWRFDEHGNPDHFYWAEGVTRLEVHDALYSRTDDRWGWLYQRRTRRALAVANPVSWLLTLYGASDLPLNLGLGDSALSFWALTPVPLWLLVRRSVRLVADAPEELLDERLVDVRNRVYVRSYRGFTAVVSVLAAIVIPFNDLGIDHDLDVLESQRQFVVAAAFALIWMSAALPSVVLAWMSPDD